MTPAAPFPYFGGKARMADQIVAMLPDHHTYVEPFFGSGAVFFAKPRSNFEILNDVNDGIVTFFRVLRDQREDLELVCGLSPHSRSEYALCDYDEPEISDVEKARRLWVSINQSFAKTGRRPTGWSRTIGANQSQPAGFRSRLGRFAVASDRLQDATIECSDAVDIIRDFDGPNTVMYVDPPYLGTSRRSGRIGGSFDYQHDMSSLEDHERLAERLLSVAHSTIILSGYPSPEYEEWFGDWFRVEIPTRTSTGNLVRNQGDVPRTEVIWSNAPINHQTRLFGT